MVEQTKLERTKLERTRIVRERCMTCDGLKYEYKTPPFATCGTCRGLGYVQIEECIGCGARNPDQCSCPGPLPDGAL